MYIAFDRGREGWQFAAGDGGKTRRELKIVRTDLAQGKRDVVSEIAKAKAHFGLPDDAPVHAVYGQGPPAIGPIAGRACRYAERFGPTAKRSRRVGIVAVARKLAIALWRYAMDGVVPEGAALKPKGPRKIAVPLEKGCRLSRHDRRELRAA